MNNKRIICLFCGKRRQANKVVPLCCNECQVPFKLWFDFRETFCHKGGKWKFKGIKMMQKIEEWAKNNNVIINKIDDESASTSYLVFIPFMDSLILVFIPQNTGENAIIMHLGKHNITETISSLRKMKSLIKWME